MSFRLTARRFLRDAGWQAHEDSHLGRRLREAGFVVLGRTNTPELATDVTTEPAAYGPCRNPYDLTRTRRRLERWLRRRGRGAHGAGRARQRRRRVAADPRERLRARRPQAHAGAHQRRAAARRADLGGGDRGGRRSPARCATPLRCSTCWPARSRATPTTRRRSPGRCATRSAASPAGCASACWCADPAWAATRRRTCAAAVSATARLLEGLGHEVGPGVTGGARRRRLRPALRER